MYRGNRSRYWKGFGEISGSKFAEIKRNAEIRNLEFNITIEYLWELFLKQNRKCIYTNIELKFSTSKQITKGFEQTASLDRIDSSKGYIEGNIQWIHKDVNKIKRNYTEKQFIQMCREIYENQSIFT